MFVTPFSINGNSDYGSFMCTRYDGKGSDCGNEITKYYRSNWFQIEIKDFVNAPSTKRADVGWAVLASYNAHKKFWGTYAGYSSYDKFKKFEG